MNEIRFTLNGKAVSYAGGTDLMVENRSGDSYLFLGKLDELREIKEDEEHIRIGAAVRTYRCNALPQIGRVA